MRASPCFDQDVFVNAVGGVRIAEPAADLAVTLAVVLELCATGRCRAASWCSARSGSPARCGPRRAARSGSEAAKLGFTHAIVPTANRPRQPIAGLEVVAVDRLVDAVDYLR